MGNYNSIKQANGRSIEKEQFYTLPDDAMGAVSLMIELVGEEKAFTMQWLEPTAGTGVFVEALLAHGVKPEKILAFDLEPKHPLVEEADFLEKVDELEGPFLVIGNPPFGLRSSLAIKVFNAVAEKAEFIGFIIPMGWRAMGIYNRLDPFMHPIADNSTGTTFTNSAGETVTACKTVFRVYEKKWVPRVKWVEEDRGYFTLASCREASIAMASLGLHQTSCLDGKCVKLPWESHYSTVHPLITELIIELRSVMRKWSIDHASTIAAYNPYIVRRILNQYLDSHPEEKAIVHDAMAAKQSITLF